MPKQSFEAAGMDQTMKKPELAAFAARQCSERS
jgi:hypothetical protein